MADDKSNGNGNGVVAALEFEKSVKKADFNDNAGLFNYFVPAYGFYGRDYVALPQYLPASNSGFYYHTERDAVLMSTIDHEGVWANAVNIATQKAASWGWEVTSEIALRQKRAQELIQDFEWLGIVDYTTAISAHIKGYLLTGRAFIEIERASSSRFSKVVALHHLDPLACRLTGNPDRPVCYMDTKSQVHELNSWEVGIFVMNPSPIERPFFNFSRPFQSAAESVYDQITQMEAIWKYLYEKTTGKRALAIDFVTGISHKNLSDAIISSDADMERKGGQLFKGSILIPIVQGDTAISHVRIDLAGLPNGFDFQEMYDNTLITYCGALGLDVNDLDPRLAQRQSLGSGTQAAMLDMKTQTKGLVIWRQQFMRFMQRLVLDDATSFSWRETSTEELTKEAEMKGKIIANVSAMLKDQIISNPQALNILVDEEVLPREFLDTDLTQANSIGDDEKDIAQTRDPNAPATTLPTEPTQEGANSNTLPSPAIQATVQQSNNGKTTSAQTSSVQGGKPSSLQQQAFNGAQISSALEIITAYNEGVIERENAVYMLGTFFQLDTETAGKLVPEKKGTTPDSENGTDSEVIPQVTNTSASQPASNGGDSSKVSTKENKGDVEPSKEDEKLARSLVKARLDEAKRQAETVIKPSKEEERE